MRIMISLPMNGESSIKISRRLKNIREEFKKSHTEVVDSNIQEYPGEEYYNKPLFYLGKSIDFIGKVDAVYFAKGWEKCRGCRVERMVCEEYGVKILESDFIEEDE